MELPSKPKSFILLLAVKEKERYLAGKCRLWRVHMYMFWRSLEFLQTCGLPTPFHWGHTAIHTERESRSQNGRNLSVPTYRQYAVPWHSQEPLLIIR